MKKINEDLKNTNEVDLTKKERRRLKKEKKQEEMRKARQRKKIKKIITIATVFVVFGGGIFSIILFASTASKLPPTTGANHSEASPQAHILTEPMPESMQRHMLEHSDGSGPSAIIVQYNCEDFECEADLVEKLSEIVKDYPRNVYLAPGDYDGKIILTRVGKREILDSFDEQAVREFIEQ